MTSPSPPRAEGSAAARSPDAVAVYRALGLSPTRGRVLILGQLTNREDLLSAQDLHHKLRLAATPVSLNAIYRALHVLAEAGELHCFLLGAEMLYRRCSPSRHCHLVCRRCSRVWEEDITAIQPWVDDVASRWQGRVLDYYADILVLCKGCQQVRDSDHVPAPAPARLVPPAGTPAFRHTDHGAVSSKVPPR